MSFTPAFLEEIRTRLPCSVVVGRKVRLKKAGREWRGLSPFNSEKTPSFFVNDAKGRWFDHSAGKNGDIFAFVCETEGLAFPDAVARLAGEAGVPMPARDPDVLKREARKLTLIEINELAATFYQGVLASKDGKAAREYIATRGIAPAQVEKYRLGVALADRSALKRRLAAEGVSIDDAVEAGLIIAGDDIPVSHDRFVDRLMFPIADAKGNTIALAGRDLSGSSPAKYLNSPATPVFDKGSTLYNLHNARQPAWDGAPAVSCEGYTATIASDDAGFPASVATMGTALTDRHLALLWRMSDEPILCFDGDAAGGRAIRKAIDTALPMLLPGRSLRFAIMPPALDPDDVVRKRGPEVFAGLIEKASPLTDSIWRALSAGRTLSQPEQRAKLEADLMEALAVIPDRQLRDKLASDMRQRVRAVPRRTVLVRSNGFSHKSASPASHRLAHGIFHQGSLSLTDSLFISALVASPAAANEVAEALVSDDTLAPHLREAAGKIINILGDLPEAQSAQLMDALRSAGAASIFDDAYSVLQRAGISPLDDAKARDILKRH